MQIVWFLYKAIETTLGLACLTIHVKGFLDSELMADHYIYVVIFFTFTLQAMFSCLNTCAGNFTTPMQEAVIDIIAAVSYIVASLETMYYAEKDFYLMYLYGNEFEAPLHPYFRYSKGQSIAALAAAVMYMVHATLVIDMMTITEEIEFDEEDDDHNAVQPIKLYIGGKKVHEYMDQNFEWFHKFGTKGVAETAV